MYFECEHYCQGYCAISKNSFGINRPCCERNDCPEFLKDYEGENLKKFKTNKI